MITVNYANSFSAFFTIYRIIDNEVLILYK